MIFEKVRLPIGYYCSLDSSFEKAIAAKHPDKDWLEKIFKVFIREIDILVLFQWKKWANLIC
jgi:hypothetical protein